jgi:hypothetical protein
MRIRITWPGGELAGRLYDTPSARALAGALPCTSRASRWGDEVYFTLPAEMSLEPGALDVVPPGTICYWVEGRSLALPYGPTPASLGDECRLVTAVNVVGQLEGDPQRLAGIAVGDLVEVALLD